MTASGDGHLPDPRGVVTGGCRCGCRNRGRGRARRGRVRAALLALLAERPHYGNEMITELAARTGGAWRPSPGSVYPTLQALSDEGLVVEQTVAGHRGFALTGAGRAAVASGPEAPWEDARPCPTTGPRPGTEPAGTPQAAVQEATGYLLDAVDQVLLVGAGPEMARVAEVLDGARRAVFQLLADAPADPPDQAG
jgi:hypothetical protein